MKRLTFSKVRPNEGNYDLCQGAKLMLEKILEAILDPQSMDPSSAAQQVPADPLSWIDELFNNGWMTHGPFGDGTAFNDATMYASGLDWLLPT